MPEFVDVERKISEIDPGEVTAYNQYWRSIQPTSLDERWQRWLFAALSIRAGWKSNREAYLSLRHGFWPTEDQLLQELLATKIGLAAMRTKAIWRLKKLLRADPRFFAKPQPDKPWTDWREARLAEIYGIGRAKVSFALEMCFPTECRVVCLDTHIQQLYGLSPNSALSRGFYEEIESHWLEVCRAMSYPPAIVRHILWDRRQGKTDTRYWSDVFETGLV